MPLPGDPPKPGIEPRSPALQADSLPSEPPRKPQNTGVGSLSLLQGIFPIQESNWGLLHCRQILYQLSYQGSPLSHLFTFKLVNLFLTPGYFEVDVAQSCVTLRDPIDYTVHGILRARILKWVAFSFSREISPTQRSNPRLQHCSQILYHKGRHKGYFEWCL